MYEIFHTNLKFLKLKFRKKFEMATNEAFNNSIKGISEMEYNHIGTSEIDTNDIEPHKNETDESGTDEASSDIASLDNKNNEVITKESLRCLGCYNKYQQVPKLCCARLVMEIQKKLKNIQQN